MDTTTASDVDIEVVLHLLIAHGRALSERIAELEREVQAMKKESAS